MPSTERWCPGDCVVEAQRLSKPFDTLCRGCTDPDIVNAWECDDGDPGDDYVQHPCPTIEALEIK